MTDSWTVYKKDEVVPDAKEGGNRCDKRLALMRCLLEYGHDGNHAVQTPPSASNDQEEPHD